MSRSSRIHLKNQNRLDNKVLNGLVMTVAFVEPLLTFGQIIQIWKFKQARGNSLLTWSFFLFSAVVWLTYGIKAKNRPLIVSSALWVLTESIVVFEILYFS
jgi:uncharacterized protein with PQ loop repeat